MTYEEFLACSVDECSKQVHCRGLCKLHYQRMWRVGSTSVSRPCLHLSTEVKFWNYAIRSEDPEACWGWRGYSDRDGYGKMRVGKTNRSAHCISWEIHNGPIPIGMIVRHRCNNEPCSNPIHLVLGDNLDNMADRMAAGNYHRNESHPRTKFSDAMVAAIRVDGSSSRDISRKFDISISQIANIRAGRQRNVLVADSAIRKVSA